MKLRRHFNTIPSWNAYFEKSSNVVIKTNPVTGGGRIELSGNMFNDFFDDGTIDPEWLALANEGVTVSESGGFLKMVYPSSGTKAGAVLIKRQLLPPTYTATVRWKVQNFSQSPSPSFFGIVNIQVNDDFNAFSQTNPPASLFFDLGSAAKHVAFRILWSRDSQGTGFMIGYMSKSTGSFKWWRQLDRTWVLGANNPIPAGKEGTEWTFEITIANDTLTVRIKDDSGTTYFDPDGIPNDLDTGPASAYLVLGQPSNGGSPPLNTTHLYNSVETNITQPGAGQGFIRFRDILKVTARATAFEIIGQITSNEQVAVKTRAADTLEKLLAAPFSNPIQGTSGRLNMSQAAFMELQLDLFSMSPGPIVDFFSYDIELAEDDNPVILSLNEVKREDLFQASENFADAYKAGDGDSDTQWISANSQDGISVNLDIILKEGNSFVERLIDTIIFRNINLGVTTITIFNIAQTQSKQIFHGQILMPDVILTFEPFLAGKIVIVSSTTQISNQTKRIGEIYAGRILTILPNFDSYEPKREMVESGQLRTLGGRLVAFRGKSKYASRWKINGVDKNKKDEIETVFSENTLITFYPEPKFRPRDLFDVAWKVEEIPFPYTDIVKLTGHTLEAEVIEI